MTRIWASGQYRRYSCMLQTIQRDIRAPKEDMVAAALFSTSKPMTAAGGGGQGRGGGVIPLHSLACAAGWWAATTESGRIGSAAAAGSSATRGFGAAIVLHLSYIAPPNPCTPSTIRTPCHRTPRHPPMITPSTRSASTGVWVQRETRARNGGSMESRLADMTMREMENMPTACKGW